MLAPMIGIASRNSERGIEPSRSLGSKPRRAGGLDIVVALVEERVGWTLRSYRSTGASGDVGVRALKRASQNRKTFRRRARNRAKFRVTTLLQIRHCH